MMSIFGKKGPTDLAEWLEIATDGLASSSKRRIVAEIEAHNQEAVAAHVARGETELTAEANALEDLGSAKAARRRFRRRHLTAKEEHQLVMLQYEGGSKLWLTIYLSLGAALFCGLILLCSSLKKHSTEALFVSWLLMCVYLPIFSFLKLRRLEGESNLPAVSMIELQRALIVLIASTLFVCLGYPTLFALAWPIISSGQYVFRSFRTWKKLRNHKSPAAGGAGIA